MTEHLDPTTLQQAVDYAGDWVGFRQRTLGFPGVVLGVRHGDDVIHLSAHGHADLETPTELTTDHVFRIASHSKMFTATAVMLMVGDGTLRLSETMGELFDWLPRDAATAEITVEQLISHGGGVIRDGDDCDYWQLVSPFFGEDDLRDIAKRALIFAPDTQFKYSNIAFAFVGLIIEARSGLTFAEFVRQRILTPLGMTATFADTDEIGDAPLVRGYSNGSDGIARMPLPHATTNAMAAATGMASTATDVLAYSAIHFDDSNALLTGAQRRAMHRPRWWVADKDFGYGLGMVVYDIDGRRFWGHSGGFPGQLTQTRIDPARRLAITVLGNSLDAPVAELMTGVIKIIHRAHKAFEDSLVAPVAGEQASNDFLGRWYSLWSVVDVVRFAERWIGIDPRNADPLEVENAYEPQSVDSLTIVTTSAMAAPGETLTLERSSEGVQLRAAGASMQRRADYLANQLPRMAARTS